MQTWMEVGYIVRRFDKMSYFQHLKAVMVTLVLNAMAKNIEYLTDIVITPELQSCHHQDQWRASDFEFVNFCWSPHFCCHIN